MPSGIQHRLRALYIGIGKSIVAETFMRTVKREPKESDLRHLRENDYFHVGTTWVATNIIGVQRMQQIVSQARKLVLPHDSQQAREALVNALDTGQLEELFAQQGGAYLSLIMRSGVVDDEEGQFLLMLDTLAAIEV